MKQLLGLVSIATLLATATPAMSHEGHHLPGEKTVTRTVTGEVVDMGCWLGHAARGEKHIECAAKCLAEGMPMGLLTTNGTLYLVTLDHDDLDPYTKLKDLAGKEVTITGEILTRSGFKAIEASAVKPASK